MVRTIARVLPAWLLLAAGLSLWAAAAGAAEESQAADLTARFTQPAAPLRRPAVANYSDAPGTLGAAALWEKFVARLREGRLEEAYACFSPLSRQVFPYSEFCLQYHPLSAAYEALLSPVDQGQLQVSGDWASLRFMAALTDNPPGAPAEKVLSPPTEPGIIVTVALTREDGQWYLVAARRQNAARAEAELRGALRQLLRRPEIQQALQAGAETDEAGLAKFAPDFFAAPEAGLCLHYYRLQIEKSPAGSRLAAWPREAGLRAFAGDATGRVSGLNQADQPADRPVAPPALPVLPGTESATMPNPQPQPAAETPAAAPTLPAPAPREESDPAHTPPAGLPAGLAANELPGELPARDGEAPSETAIRQGQALLPPNAAQSDLSSLKSRPREEWEKWPQKWRDPDAPAWPAKKLDTHALPAPAPRTDDPTAAAPAPSGAPVSLIEVAEQDQTPAAAEPAAAHAEPIAALPTPPPAKPESTAAPTEALPPPPWLNAPAAASETPPGPPPALPQEKPALTKPAPAVPSAPAPKPAAMVPPQAVAAKPPATEIEIPAAPGEEATPAWLRREATAKTLDRLPALPPTQPQGETSAAAEPVAATDGPPPLAPAEIPGSATVDPQARVEAIGRQLETPAAPPPLPALDGVGQPTPPTPAPETSRTPASGSTPPDLPPLPALPAEPAAVPDLGDPALGSQGGAGALPAASIRADGDVPGQPAAKSEPGISPTRPAGADAPKENELPSALNEGELR